MTIFCTPQARLQGQFDVYNVANARLVKFGLRVTF